MLHCAGLRPRFLRLFALIFSHVRLLKFVAASSDEAEGYN